MGAKYKGQKTRQISFDKQTDVWLIKKFGNDKKQISKYVSISTWQKIEKEMDSEDKTDFKLEKMIEPYHKILEEIGTQETNAETEKEERKWRLKMAKQKIKEIRKKMEIKK